MNNVLKCHTNTKAFLKCQSVLEFIRKFYVEHGIPPSARDIQDGLGFKSPRSSTLYVEWLLAEGFLKRTKVGWARSFIPVGYKVIKIEADNNS